MIRYCTTCGAELRTCEHHEQEVERLRAELDTSSATPGLVYGLRQEVERLRAVVQTATAKRCVWKYDDTHYKWDSTCGNAWQFSNDASVQENGLKYCPFCGGLVREAEQAGGE